MSPIVETRDGLLLTYSDFSHAIYNIIALYILALKPIPKSEAELVESTGAAG